MRLFIAAELPEPMLEALAETSALLRESVHGRFVAPDSYHVTLAFLGTVELYRTVEASEAIDAASRSLHVQTAVFGDLGSFGRRASATLWQGFGNPGNLCEAAALVREELARRDLTFDEKAFKPHVTLMRAADLTGGTLPTPCLAEGDIKRITLFRSDLTGPRPHYEPLHTVELAR